MIRRTENCFYILFLYQIITHNGSQINRKIKMLCANTFDAPYPISLMKLFWETACSSKLSVAGLKQAYQTAKLGYMRGLLGPYLIEKF
jgi:hypothetical protein